MIQNPDIECSVDVSGIQAVYLTFMDTDTGAEAEIALRDLATLLYLQELLDRAKTLLEASAGIVRD